MKRHAIKWDRGRQQWICTDLSTFKRVGAFDTLAAAEHWVLGLDDEADDVLDLDEVMDPEAAS